MFGRISEVRTIAGDDRANRWRSRGRLASSAVVAMLLVAPVAMGSAGLATADPGMNISPDTATTISTLPSSSPGLPYWTGETGVETDSVSVMVAEACSDGVPIYAARWWKVAPATSSTFVTHTYKTNGGLIEPLQPINTAFVSGDLSTVVGCGGSTFQNDYIKAGPFVASAAEPMYVVTYETADPGLDPGVGFWGPELVVFASNGVTPSNQLPTSPMVIDSLPFSVTQDTTLAIESSFAPCYTKWGYGPGVWYSWTATTTDLVDIIATADYGIQTIVAMPLEGDPIGEEACRSRFPAEEGVTYLIGVFGYGDTAVNVGHLTVDVHFVPPAPTVELTIAPTGTVDKKTGIAQVTGEIRCVGNDGDSTGSITGTLKQVYKRIIHETSFSGPGVPCTGQPVMWQATVQSTSFLFTNGSTTVTAAVTACNERGCTEATAQGTVTLKVK